MDVTSLRTICKMDKFKPSTDHFIIEGRSPIEEWGNGSNGEHTLLVHCLF